VIPPRRILVIGAGLMGSQIGCEFALAGHDVLLYARDLAAARERVGAALGLARRAGLCDTDMARGVERRLGYTDSVTDGSDGCDVVLESVSEEIELKGRLLGTAARVAPRALLATNTSSLRITDVGAAAGAPERTVGIHYLNPPLLMPPVEIVAGEQTSGERIDAACALVASAGKTPVVVQRDVHGFVWNRLQLAVIRESVRLIQDGVLSSEDVDAIVRHGLARRWRRDGPLQTMAREGPDTWNELAASLVADLSVAPELPDLTAFAVQGEETAEEVRARDDALIHEL
jgi:3-hydroxybutyryl-CoA dehydrogenase